MENLNDYFENRTYRERLRSRFHNHRSQPLCLPLGQFPTEQSSHQIAYSSRFAWQHPNLHSYQRRQASRCQRARQIDSRAWQLLHHGPWISGFCQTISHKSMGRFFRYQSQIKFPISPHLLSPNRTGHRSEMRPDNQVSWVLPFKRVSRQVAQNKVFRFYDRKNFCLPDKQLYITSTNHSGFVSMSLAGGVVFQMDQTTPANQIIFRHKRERCQIPGLDCSFSLYSRGHYQKTAQNHDQSLHNSTGFELNHFRENATITDSYEKRLQKQN